VNRRRQLLGWSIEVPPVFPCAAGFRLEACEDLSASPMDSWIHSSQDCETGFCLLSLVQATDFRPEECAGLAWTHDSLADFWISASVNRESHFDDEQDYTIDFDLVAASWPSSLTEIVTQNC